jgi:hypothetical protein
MSWNASSQSRCLPPDGPQVPGREHHFRPASLELSRRFAADNRNAKAAGSTCEVKPAACVFHLPTTQTAVPVKLWRSLFPEDAVMVFHNPFKEHGRTVTPLSLRVQS